MFSASLFLLIDGLYWVLSAHLDWWALDLPSLKVFALILSHRLIARALLRGQPLLGLPLAVVAAQFDEADLLAQTVWVIELVVALSLDLRQRLHVLSLAIVPLMEDVGIID